MGVVHWAPIARYKLPYYVRFAQTKEQAQGHLRDAQAKRLRKEARRLRELSFDALGRFAKENQRWINALNSHVEFGEHDPWTTPL